MPASVEVFATIVAAAAVAEVPAELSVLGAVAIAVRPTLHCFVVLFGALRILVAAESGSVDSAIYFATPAAAQSYVEVVDEPAAARGDSPHVDAQVGVI